MIISLVVGRRIISFKVNPISRHAGERTYARIQDLFPPGELQVIKATVLHGKLRAPETARSSILQPGQIRR